MADGSNNLVFSIVIPAYNEEEAIASICERCIAARDRIIAETDVTEVEITVVSDGSHDKTPEIAATFKDRGINLIAYEKNRGYGAAIKTGYDNSHGDLLSFLDADGTCDPLFFITLINRLRKEHADIALGSRMGPQSEMPAVRVLGNRLYAFLLGILSNTVVKDTASGMRVMTRESLEKVYPLPDGLNFTPAMSAKALLDGSIRIIEEPMPYKERIGRSKLSVVKDGFRFLRIILDVALTYRPLRMFSIVSAILFVIAFLYGIGPLLKWISEGEIEDRLVYRIITVMVLFNASTLLFLTGLVTERAIALTYPGERKWTFSLTMLWSLFSQRNLVIVGPVLILAAIILNAISLFQYITRHEIDVSWFVIAAGGILAVFGVQLFAAGVMMRALDLLKERKEFLRK